MLSFERTLKLSYCKIQQKNCGPHVIYFFIPCVGSVDCFVEEDSGSFVLGYSQKANAAFDCEIDSSNVHKEQNSSKCDDGPRACSLLGKREIAKALFVESDKRRK